MASIANLKTSDDKPYQLPLRAMVFVVADRRSYTNNGEEKEFRPVVIADKTGVIRVNMYDLKREGLLKTGKSILLRGYIVRSERVSGKKYLVATTITKILEAAAVSVPDDMRKEGENLINPKPAPQTPVDVIKRSPVKTFVSVTGQIVSEEVQKTWNINGKDVKVKSVNIRDETGTCHLSLWRALAEADVAAGQYVSVTNVVVSQYPKNEISLSTTVNSKITKTKQPAAEMTIVIEAYERDGEQYSLCVTKDGEFLDEQLLISKNLLDDHLGLGQDVIAFEELLPLEIHVKVKGLNTTDFI